MEDDSKLVFNLERHRRHDEGPAVAFSKDPAASRATTGGGGRSGGPDDVSLEEEEQRDLGLDLRSSSSSQAFHVPRSPSSPGSLADLSSSSVAAGLLLVKSSSTELDPCGGFPPRASKPLLLLGGGGGGFVKSPSIEMCRRGSGGAEPEANLSKSDSRLHHMPPWRMQLAQQPNKLPPEGRRRPEALAAVTSAAGADENDAHRRCSSSPASPPLGSPRSPTEIGSLMAELEDTRRKFSEAMQDRGLSMLSKMMGDESPKQARRCSSGGDPPQQAAPLPGGGMAAWSEDAGEPDVQQQLRCRARKTEGVCDTPLRRAHKSASKSSFHSPPYSPEAHSQSGGGGGGGGGDGGRYEICEYGDIIQVVQLQGRGGPGNGATGGSRGRTPPRRPPRPRPRPRSLVVVPPSPPPLPRGSGSSLPYGWFFCVGLLAYGVLVLPLPPYVTGLSVGLACGFLLGLVVVFVFAPPRRGNNGNNRPRARRCSRRPVGPPPAAAEPPDEELNIEPHVLEGWMNEMFSYDPEAYQPSLTHSVFATLEGSRLRLAYPRANVPRGAAFDEPPHEAVFVRSCTYQLANCKVSLLPPVLARKRVWNKKYPICVALAEGEVGEEESLMEEGLQQPEEEEEKKEVEEEEERQTPAAAAASPLPDPLPRVLYLFGRTGREKEEWFQHFLSASGANDGSPSREESRPEVVCAGGDAVRGSTEELRELPGAVRERLRLDYDSYMSNLIGSGGGGSPTPSPWLVGPLSPPSDQGSPTARKKIPSDESVSGSRAGGDPPPQHGSGGGSGGGGSPSEANPAWVNSLVGRIFWDFLREKYWSDQVAHKLQKKLSKIRLPYFMNELTLADLDMGTCLPVVLSTSKPSLDHRGLWLEMEVVYTGCIQMTLQTKMNLCRLGKDSGAETPTVPQSCPIGSKPRLCVLADSDEESSSAGSSDEEEVPPIEPQGTLGDKTSPPPVADGHTGGSTGRKFLRFVDKIAKSKYFQKATENEYIKKKFTEMSNMPLLLAVEVLELSGTLAVNIPPPPTDRIWYSFRVPPRLDLNVRPMLGDREVTFTHVTEWIERKLQCEFQKVLVMPNMDDLYLPLMTSGLEDGGFNPSASPGLHSPSARSASRQSSVESQEYLSE